MTQFFGAYAHPQPSMCNFFVFFCNNEMPNLINGHWIISAILVYVPKHIFLNAANIGHTYMLYACSRKTKPLLMMMLSALQTLRAGNHQIARGFYSPRSSNVIINRWTNNRNAGDFNAPRRPSESTVMTAAVLALKHNLNKNCLKKCFCI